jgi:hypothetical protein
MVVDKIENVTLNSGEMYSNAVRISNPGSSGRYNYYWYAQGVGLIKYVINSRNDDNPSGQIEGELVSYYR